jgi:MurNAc alpha-1-phosphate uridylyltransferase
MSSVPRTAMVLAAGLGVRMRPLTDAKPKPLVQVAGKALIDHTLDRLVAAGITRAVVNVHAFADQMEAHLRARRDIEILISDERARLLETGGAVKKARALLGEDPIWVANADYVWLEEGDGALARLARTWDPGIMDVVVIVIPKGRTSGFDTPGDFFADAAGRLSFRGAATQAPLHCFGIEIIDPAPLYAWPEPAFSQREALWAPAAARGRLYGVEPDGFWMQIGDPAAKIEAEARLARAGTS